MAICAAAGVSQGREPCKLRGVTRTQGRPSILEVKRTLSGREKRFVCQVLVRDTEHLMVLFISREKMLVHGIELPAGTVTFGHFWQSRPYNVYHWLRPDDGSTIGVYANICDETRFSAEAFTWLDLVVDVLALPGKAPVVLDEDEIPAECPAALREKIAASLACVLGALPALLVELERDRATWWPVVAGDVAAA